MKASSLILSVVASVLLLASLPTVALAQQGRLVPEPSAFLIWAGITAAGGFVYWGRNRRQK